MSTLYRLYRPQVFSDFVGQDTSRQILQNALIAGRTVNSYLFTGPRGTGKTSLARVFAKALNCQQFDMEGGEVCNTCANCQAITQGSFVDLIEIDAASNRGIDEIRNLRESVRYAPSHKAKVFIIDEAHMLTKDASNALLKTLEEPPRGVYLILVTTDAEKLLPTIHSRVQKLAFYPLSYPQLKKKLRHILETEGVNVDDAVLESIIVLAEGGARNAESILGQLLSTTDETHITEETAEPILGQNTQQEAYHLLSLVGKDDLADGIRYINHLYTSGVAFAPFIDTLLLTARRVLLARVSPELVITDESLESDRAALTELSQTLSETLLDELLRGLREAKESLETAPTPQLPLELTLTHILSKQDTGSAPQSSSPSTDPASNASAPSHTNQSKTSSGEESSSPPPSSSSSATSNSEYAPVEQLSSKADASPAQETASTESSSAEAHSSPSPQPKGSANIASLMPHLQKAIEAEQTSLAPFFEQCRFQSHENSVVTFQAASSFQKRKLDQHRETIEALLERLGAGQVRVQFRLEETAVPPSSSNATHSPGSSSQQPEQETSTVADTAAEDATLESPDEVEQAATDLFQNSV
jgi:DNA polymerase-3 subunit gamma/tau